MANKALLTMSEEHRKVKDGFITIAGKYRKLKKALITIAGKYRLCYLGELPPSKGLSYSLSYFGVGDSRYQVMGRGSCTDSVIVIPETHTENGETWNVYLVGGFSGDTAITELHLQKSVASRAYEFKNCTNLKKVYNTQEVKYKCFSNCPSLELVKFRNGANIEQSAFTGLPSNAVYDFTACTKVCTVSAYDALDFGEGQVAIVPAHLLNEWKSATNWTVYAKYIKAAE